MSPPRPSSSSCVLDSSALLAVLQQEPGAETVETLLEEAVISSVNWSEVVQKSLDRGVEFDNLPEDLEALGLSIAPFSVEEAEIAAVLRRGSAELGLSLAGRACLALASKLSIPALTTDSTWAELELDSIFARLIR